MSHILPVYNRADIKFIKGKGAFLFDEDGKKYLDFTAGIATLNLGHLHKKPLKALLKQAKRLWHTSNLYAIDGMEELAEKLCKMGQQDYAFFCNSGAEANEGVIKMIRRYQYANNKPKRNRIIVFEGAFHGRTNACLATSTSPKMVEGFAPLLPGFDITKRDKESFLNAITDETAGVLLEPIQGDGAGVKTFPPELLKLIEKECKERDLVFAVDEVQAGIGRTGKFFSHQNFNVVPDIISIAKGLGNGFPVGAILCKKNIGESMTAGTHGSTFGGNPLAIKVATAVIDEINTPETTENIQKRSQEIIAFLSELKQKYPNKIVAIRGIGLMLGLRIEGDLNKFINNCRQKGLLLVMAAENVARILPPLNINKKHVELFSSIIKEVIDEGKF